MRTGKLKWARLSSLRFGSLQLSSVGADANANNYHKQSCLSRALPIGAAAVFLQPAQCDSSSSSLRERESYLSSASNSLQLRLYLFELELELKLELGALV